MNPRGYGDMAMGRDSMPADRFSRRRALRLAGGGLTLAVLAVGAAGCREDGSEVGGSGGSGDGASGGNKATTGGAGKDGAGNDGQAPEPLWTKTTSALTYGDNDELVAAGGVVIASGEPLAALNATSGKEQWSLKDGAVPGAPMLLGKGTLYLASAGYDGTVAGYDPASGKETWRSHLGKEYRQPRPIAADDEQLYVVAEILEADGSSKTNVIAALNSTTGRLAWKEQRDLGTEENGIHAQVQGRHLVYTDFKKNLTVRDTATGKQVWTHRTTKTNYGFFAVYKDLVIVPQGPKLQAFSLADGSAKWSVETAESYVAFKEPAVLDDVLYIADSDRTLRALDPRTGTKIWQSDSLADAKLTVPRQYVKAGGLLYAATALDEQGGVIAIDPKTGAVRWTFNDKSGDYHAWLVATDGKHVFALHGTKLHALPV